MLYAVTKSACEMGNWPIVHCPSSCSQPHTPSKVYSALNVVRSVMMEPEEPDDWQDVQCSSEDTFEFTKK